MTTETLTACDECGWDDATSREVERRPLRRGEHCFCGFYRWTPRFGWIAADVWHNDIERELAEE